MPPPPAYQAAGLYVNRRSCTEFVGSSDQYEIRGELQILRFDWLDGRTRIIAGTFEFDFINTACNNEITQITDGRFDLLF